MSTKFVKSKKKKRSLSADLSNDPQNTLAIKKPDIGAYAEVDVQSRLKKQNAKDDLENKNAQNIDDIEDAVNVDKGASNSRQRRKSEAFLSSQSQSNQQKTFADDDQSVSKLDNPDGIEKALATVDKAIIAKWNNDFSKIMKSSQDVVKSVLDNDIKNNDEYSQVLQNFNKNQVNMGQTSLDTVATLARLSELSRNQLWQKISADLQNITLDSDDNANNDDQESQLRKKKSYFLAKALADLKSQIDPQNNLPEILDGDSQSGLLIGLGQTVDSVQKSMFKERYVSQVEQLDADGLKLLDNKLSHSKSNEEGLERTWGKARASVREANEQNVVKKLNEKMLDSTIQGLPSLSNSIDSILGDPAYTYAHGDKSATRDGLVKMLGTLRDKLLPTATEMYKKLAPKKDEQNKTDDSPQKTLKMVNDVINNLADEIYPPKKASKSDDKKDKWNGKTPFFDIAVDYGSIPEVVAVRDEWVAQGIKEGRVIEINKRKYEVVDSLRRKDPNSANPDGKVLVATITKAERDKLKEKGTLYKLG